MKILYKNLPFVYFIGALALVYITNAHYAEKKVRKIMHLQQEVKEKRSEYTAILSDVMTGSLQSELEKELASEGLIIDEIPQKLVVKNSLKKENDN